VLATPNRPAQSGLESRAARLASPSLAITRLPDTDPRDSATGRPQAPQQRCNLSPSGDRFS
jgi:hypothetical protein